MSHRCPSVFLFLRSGSFNVTRFREATVTEMESDREEAWGFASVRPGPHSYSWIPSAVW